MSKNGILRRNSSATKKNQKNTRRRGISFERAKTIFDGIVYSEIDNRPDYGEVREGSIGLLESAVVAVVIHANRHGKIRIIF